MPGNMFRAIKITLAFHKGDSSIVVFIDAIVLLRDSDFFQNHAEKNNISSRLAQGLNFRFLGR